MDDTSSFAELQLKLGRHEARKDAKAIRRLERDIHSHPLISSKVNLTIPRVKSGNTESKMNWRLNI